MPSQPSVADDLPIPPRPSSSGSSSSSMDYLNAQLQSNGFTRRPLSVGGLGSAEREQLAKCLFALLQQRADDLASLEAVSTAHRTLAYDHERLTKMFRSSRDDAAVAERKEHAARSQLTAAQTALKLEQESHRKTRDEVAKARTALAFVRTQAAHDLKRKESETNRVLDRWQKASSELAKQQSSRSGLTLVNYVDSRGLALLQPLPEPSRFHQAAMDELEDSRARIVEENDAFRRVLLQLGQHLQQACVALGSASAENEAGAYPETITPSSLFDPTTAGLFGSTSTPAEQRAEAALQPSTTSHASAARATILGLLSQLQVRVRAVRSIELAATPSDAALSEDDELSRARAAAAQETIRSLEEELGRLQVQLEERQAFLEDFMRQSATLESVRAEVVDGDATSDATSQAALAKQREALEEERRRYTEAAVKLGKDRIELEAEQLRFLEEKRSLQMAALIADLPPTPEHATAAASSFSTSSSSEAAAVAHAKPSSPRSAHLTPARRNYGRRSSPLARSALAKAASTSSTQAEEGAPTKPSVSARPYLSGLGKENIGTPRKAVLGGMGGAAGGERRRSRLGASTISSPGKPRVGRTSLSVRS